MMRIQKQGITPVARRSSTCFERLNSDEIVTVVQVDGFFYNQLANQGVDALRVSVHVYSAAAIARSQPGQVEVQLSS